jgi:hypothetical protein
VKCRIIRAADGRKLTSVERAAVAAAERDRDYSISLAS